MKSETQFHGFDWTAPPRVPSDLKRDEAIGRCSWIEDHLEHRITYIVSPDGTARAFHYTISPDGTARPYATERFGVGEWRCDYFRTWSGCGSRSGCDIVPNEEDEEKRDLVEEVLRALETF